MVLKGKGVKVWQRDPSKAAPPEMLLGIDNNGGTAADEKQTITILGGNIMCLCILIKQFHCCKI
jgi:hypothetical protein